MEATLTLRITGTRPMLMHNGRLANPMDPHTRAIKAISKKKGATDADLANLAQLEARGGMYETVDGKLGLPSENVWSCLRESARAFKTGKQVAQALLCPLDVVPILINGDTVKCDSYLSDKGHPERLSYVPVVIQRRRIMRARPVVMPGWQATVEFTLLTDVLQVETLVPIIERAGRLVGLGDRRPMYGTFTAEILNNSKRKK